MICTLVTVENLKFERNLDLYLWKLVCEILLISIDIFISLDISKKNKNNIESKPVMQPPLIDSYNRPHN